jgi:REP element-mobilizing transposase RayT
MSLWHLTLASMDRQVLFPDETALRRALRSMVRVLCERLLLFAIVDDHLHCVLKDENPGQRGRALRLSLRPLCASAPDKARFRPVKDRQHLLALVRYVLDQERHHGIVSAPALSSGSCAADLLGYRRLPGLDLQLWTALPRFQPASVAALVNLHPRDLDPLKLEEVRGLSPRQILDAAAFVTGADTGLGSRTEEAARARLGALHLGMKAGFSGSELANAMSLSRQGLWGAARRSPDPMDLQAILRRLAVEESVHRRSLSTSKTISPRPMLPKESPMGSARSLR